MSGLIWLVFLLKRSGRLPTSPESADILKNTSEISSIVDSEDISYSMAQINFKNYLV